MYIYLITHTSYLEINDSRTQNCVKLFVWCL